MILVTGASGKTGHAIMLALAQTGVPVRVMIRYPSQIDAPTRVAASEAHSRRLSP